MMTRAAVTVLAAALAAGACAGSPDGPGGQESPSLQILAGAGVTDTSGTEPAQALAVLVGGPGAVGAVVNFAAVPPPGCAPWDAGCPRVALAAPLATGWASSLSTTAGADGRALARVRLGDAAGAAEVIVNVPAFGLVDTAHYSVLPGAGVALVGGPRDTLVELGSSFAGRFTVIDRNGNPRSDPLTYEGTYPIVLVDGTGRATAATLGHGYLRVRATVQGTEKRDSVSLLVVPAASFAVSGYYTGDISLRRLAGGAGQRLARGIAPDWAPAGDRAVYVVASQGLFLADTAGQVTGVSTPGITNPGWPRFSADGAWIYFQSTPSGDQLYRVHPDGSGLEPLVAAGGWYLKGESPAPSPDGTRVAFAAGDRVLIFTPATGQVDTVFTGLGTHIVSWARDGQWIACMDVYGLHVFRPDGSQPRSIPGYAWGGIAWSPDSKWLVVGSGGELSLVDVTAGVLYPLHVPGWYVAWRP